MLSMIVACGLNGIIGQNGHLPWNLPEDLKRFKQLTLGHKIIMGRKTFETVGLLPGRDIYVASRDLTYLQPEGTTLVREFWQFLDEHKETAEEVFIAGGAQMYQQAMPECSRFYFTFVQGNIEGNVSIDLDDFHAIYRSQHLILKNRQTFRSISGHSHDFTFMDYGKLETSSEEGSLGTY